MNRSRNRSGSRHNSFPPSCSCCHKYVTVPTHRFYKYTYNQIFILFRDNFESLLGNTGFQFIPCGTDRTRLRTRFRRNSKCRRSGSYKQKEPQHQRQQQLHDSSIRWLPFLGFFFLFPSFVYCRYLSIICSNKKNLNTNDNNNFMILRFDGFLFLGFFFFFLLLCIVDIYLSYVLCCLP